MREQETADFIVAPIKNPEANHNTCYAIPTTILPNPDPICIAAAEPSPSESYTDWKPSIDDDTAASEH